MKKILSILIIALVATTPMLADDVSAEQALQIARQFANGPAVAQARMRRAPAAQPAPKLAHAMKSRVAAGKDNVYVINYGNDQGFVVVSGETGADDVLLGYCDHGEFSYDNAPIQLKDLLASYSEQVDSLRQNPTSIARLPRRAKADIGAVRVGPLLTTTWNQWAPYNNQCPESPDGYSLTYGGRCATGCLPTAIAQLMYYWKWPKESQGKLMNRMTGFFDGEDFSGHKYDWDNMLDNYGYDYTLTTYTDYDDVQANAVAKLMADIGTAFFTTYGTPEGSPTEFRSSPLTYNFGYSPDIQEHQGATAQELISVMKNDLDQLRPILYSGQPAGKGEGHALVCDGYTSNDYFHFNYGWSGSSDGWYKNALCSQYSHNCVIFTGVYPVSAKTRVIDNMEYSFLANGEAHIVKYNLQKVTDAVVEIPDEVTDDEGNSYKVTRIWKNAFYNKGHFNKITLGNNVKAINPSSFAGSEIDTLIIGDKVEEIPDEAFQITRIKSLTIGASVKRIGKRAFYACFRSRMNVVCKSPAFEVDDEAFSVSLINSTNVEWLSHITKLGNRAFYGTKLKFESPPQFDNLEEIGAFALSTSTFPNDEFHISPKLRKIDPMAFESCQLKKFIVDEANPYFSAHESSPILFNKTRTSLVLLLQSYVRWEDYRYSSPFPKTMIKMEPGSVCPVHERNSRTDMIVIPSHVVEMEGAFKNCGNLQYLYCCSVVPPVVSDSTFNDEMVVYDIKMGNWTTTLYVPEQSIELYRKAPGWRRFRSIQSLEKEGERSYIDKSMWDYYLTPPQHQYDMVVHYTDEEGRKIVNVPVSEVGNVKMDDNGSKVIVSRPGQEDLTIDAAQMDSITWKPGFVYDGGEVFNVNDSTLTAKAQNCTVTLSPTVIDRPAQLTIRNSVLTPEMAENMVRGVAVDISLSTGEHDLTGMVKIAIPFEKREGETLKAVYFNRETGEWEPTYFWYDEDEEAVVILTSHFTEYGVCSLRDVNTPMVTIEKYDLGVYDFTASLKKLYDIASKEDIDAAAVQAFRDDYSFWQAVGIDGGWNALQACGFNDEAIGNACDIVGYLGTAVTVLDVAKADLNRDDIGVASNSMKAICGFLTGKAASAIGTSLMQTSMIGVAAIGILLEKFGTMVQQRKKDLVRAAYRHYYSEAGVDLVWNQTIFKDGDLSYDYFDRERKYPNRQWRSKRDWNMYFRTAIDKGKTTPENFQLLIEQAVRMYCQRFWDDSHPARSYCYDWAKAQGLTSQLNAEDDKALQQQISDEYFAELMAGDITEVFSDLRKYSEEVEGKRVLARMEELRAMMNTVFVLKPYDSTKKRGEKSKYAGWRLRFAEVPADAANPADWECVIGDDGTATLEFTKYALVKNQIKAKFILTDDRGIDQKVYEYRIPNKNGKLTQKLDLATGGTVVEAPELKELELDYNPPTADNHYTMTGTIYTGTPDEQYYELPACYVEYSSMEGMYNTLFLNGWLNKKARFQTEIERFFKQHDFIVVDQFGNIQIGDDIVGKFEGDEGKGSFTITTTHPFVEETLDEFLQRFNAWEDVLLRNCLDGTIEHKIDCHFTLTRIPDSEEYAVSYTGEGTYSFKANVVDVVEGVVFFDDTSSRQHVVKEQIHTREVSQEGNVTLKYKTKLK